MIKVHQVTSFSRFSSMSFWNSFLPAETKPFTISKVVNLMLQDEKVNEQKECQSILNHSNSDISK